MISPKRIVGNLLVLDEFLNDDWMDEEWFLDYLDFNPTDPIQFEVAQNLRRYYYGRYPNFRTWVTLEGFETFETILIGENIPLCKLTAGQSFREAINRCASNTYNQKTLIKLKSVLISERVVSKLHALKNTRQEFLNQVDRPEGAILSFMEENFDHLDLRIESIEIAGSANPNWSRFESLPMEPVGGDRILWQLETSLVNGWIKFRTDEGWTFEWGKGEINPEKLTFKGSQIPVKEGYYKILLDLKEKSYELIPIQ